jgi:HAE1 family hydrophobic/amphiphilic exporter-1
MRIVSMCMNRPVTVLMAVAAVMVFGVVSYQNLQVDLLPDLQYPVINITTEYSGASAQEVDKEITVPLVEAVSSISGIKSVQSVSSEGRSEITVQFHWGTDTDFAALYVREKADDVTLPEGVARPVIMPANPATMPIMTIAVSGKGSLYQIKNAAERILKPRLEQLEGVAAAEVKGGGTREIEIIFDPQTVAQLNIKLSRLNDLLKSFDMDHGSGTIRKGDYRFSIRTQNRLSGIDEIRNLVFEVREEMKLPLSDIADVREVILPDENPVRYNGNEIISVEIYKEAGRNTVAVSAEAESAVSELRKNYPEIGLEVIYRQADFIEGAISSVIQSLIFGALLAFAVLYLFMNDFKSSLIIGLSIPVSIIGTFTLLFGAKVNINLMTLSGLALGVGMLVDNSIVALENIYRKRKEGSKPYEAAFVGTNEIGLSITASTFTTIAVFLPIVYVRGVAAALFRDEALAVTFSLLISLVVAITILPLLAYKLLGAGQGRLKQLASFTFKGQLREYLGAFNLLRQDRWAELLGIVKKCKWWMIYRHLWFAIRAIMFVIGEILKLPFMLALFIIEIVTDFVIQVLMGPAKFLLKKSDSLLKKIGGGFNRLYERFEDRYHNAEVRVLDNKGSFITFILFLLILAVALSLALDRQLIPETDTGRVKITLEFPAGTLRENIQREVGGYERSLLQRPEVESIYTSIGNGGGDEDSPGNSQSSARLSVLLKPGVDSDRFIRSAIEKRPAVFSAFAAEREFSVIEQLILTLRKQFTVKVFARETEEAYPYALKLLKEMKESDAFFNPEIINYFLQPELKGRFNREMMASAGLSYTDVIDFITNVLRGSMPLEIKKEDIKIPVRSKIGGDKNVEYGKLMSLFYTDAKGRNIPLSALITLEPGESNSSYYREGNKTYIEISAGLNESVNTAAAEIRNITEKLHFPEHVQVSVGGEYIEMKDSFSSLFVALCLSIFLVYMILAAQFESLLNPFIVMLTIPLGFISTILILFLFGISVNIISIIGFIVLMGVVVNDGIIKVDRIGQLRAQGMTVREAVLVTGRQRLRPILITSMTTLFGLLPMALMPGQGSDLYSPLAFVIIGGESICLALTLFFIPVMYEILNPEREKDGAKKRKEIKKGR